MKKKKAWFGWAVVKKNGTLVNMGGYSNEAIVSKHKGVAKSNCVWPKDAERVIRVRITEVR